MELPHKQVETVVYSLNNLVPFHRWSRGGPGDRTVGYYSRQCKFNPNFAILLGDSGPTLGMNTVTLASVIDRVRKHKRVELCDSSALYIVDLFDG